jgi:hypothetical protein
MYRLVAYRYRAVTGFFTTMKFSVLVSHASEHWFAFSDINQQRRTDVEGCTAGQRRSPHECHVKDAQEVHIIVGRLVFQLEVNEPATNRKMQEEWVGQKQLRSRLQCPTIMSIWRQNADQWNEFIGRLTTQLRETSAGAVPWSGPRALYVGDLPFGAWNPRCALLSPLPSVSTV